MELKRACRITHQVREESLQRQKILVGSGGEPWWLEKIPVPGVRLLGMTPETAIQESFGTGSDSYGEVVTLNLGVETEPLVVVTTSAPIRAPTGIVSVIALEEVELGVIFTPLNFTLRTELNLSPFMVTVVPPRTLSNC